MPPDGEKAIADAAAAFGAHPTFKARDHYYKTYGEDAYASEQKDWNSDPRYLKPGVWPAKYGEPPKDQTPQGDSKNPWSAAGWSLTRQGSIVKSLGLEAAQRMAKSAGSFVGATGPARAA